MHSSRIRTARLRIVSGGGFVTFDPGQGGCCDLWPCSGGGRCCDLWPWPGGGVVTFDPGWGCCDLLPWPRGRCCDMVTPPPCSMTEWQTPVLAIIVKYGVLITEWACLYQTLLMKKESIVNSVRVDDWTIELAIIASNDPQKLQKNLRIYKIFPKHSQPRFYSSQRNY